MMLRRAHLSRRIRLRLLALALIPAILVSTVFVTYSIFHSRQHGQVLLAERGHIMAKNLARSAELPVIAGDRAQLEALCKALREQPEVLWAAIRDARFGLLAESGPDVPFPTRSQRFSRPVGLGGLPLAENLEQTTATASTPILGWAEVRLSTDFVEADQRGELRISMIVVVTALALAVLASLFLGADLSRGLDELSRATLLYGAGNRGVRVRRQQLEELDELARCFNRMAYELERSETLMQQRVDDATTELKSSLRALGRKNRALEQARAAALAANHDKDQFLARMSHEMRTPLNAVIGFGRLLSEEAHTDAASDYSQTLDRAAHQLLSIIDDLLTYAKLRSSAPKIQTEPFDLRACLEDVVAMLGPEAYSRGLELALAVHSNVPDRLHGDGGRIGQVLLNLLNNAIKFTREGHVFVEAGYDQDQDRAGVANGRISISVTDTGIGLSAEQCARLFQPFEQADPAITRRYSGTGLGLAITKRLIEQMGGEIRVRSSPGQGSRFSLSLPSRSVDGLAPTPTAPIPLAHRVLFCDPAAIQVRALRALLVSAGLDVFATSDPQRLTNMLQQAQTASQPFDILILGVGSPRLPADQLEHQLASIRAVFKGPLLLLVGHPHWRPDPPPLGWSALAEPFAWTTKPVRRSRLMRLLAQLCGEEARRDVTAPRVARPQYTELQALVVDDNGFNRSLMRRLLEMRGIEVFEAEDGPEATRLMASLDLDLVFMDIHMPTMDGVEVTKRDRASSPTGQRRRIIALSADAFVAERIPDFFALFDGFLLKPVSETALDDAIGRALQDTRPQASSRSQLADLGGKREEQADSLALSPDWQHRLAEELNQQLEKIQTAIANADRKRLRRHLHDLRGVCGLFGLDGLSHSVREMSRIAKTAPMQMLDHRFDALREAILSERKHPS